jgi:hypothetical protein
MRRFKGSQAEHKEVAVLNAQKLRKVLRDANLAVSRGHCPVALHQLIKAASLHGRWFTERSWTNKREKSDSSRAIGALEAKIRKTCCFGERRYHNVPGMCDRRGGPVVV